MSKQKKRGPSSIYQSTILFSKELKNKKDRDLAFRKFLALLEENRESFHAKIKTRKRKREIILDSENFMFNFSFGKSPRTEIIMNDPEKNKALVNEVGNKITNYLNTILGEVATGARVSSMKIVFYPKKIPNLAEKIIGTGRIAKINEIVEQTLKARSVSLEYTIGDRNFMFSSFSGERGIRTFGSKMVYKESIPFNLLESEIAQLSNPEEILKKLLEMEL